MMPSAFTLFESMHNTTEGGKPARIANGSWGTRYRAYPYSCKFFDEALHGKFEGDLYVASAGNEGLNTAKMTSIERTIGNPASCKNTLAGKNSKFFKKHLYCSFSPKITYLNNLDTILQLVLIRAMVTGLHKGHMV